MNQIYEEGHLYDGNEYRIRIVETGDEFIARAFLNNKPASYMFSVERMTRISFKNSFGYDPFIDMIKSAKNDVEGEVGQKFRDLYQ